MYALVASECVARVESFLALVTVEGARVTVDGRHVVPLDGLRLERGTTDLTEVGTDRGVTRLVLAQVGLKHVKIEIDGCKGKDLTEVGTDRGVTRLVLAQVHLKHVVKVKFSGFANRF